MNYRMLAAAAAISISALGSTSCSDDPAPAGPTGPPLSFSFTSTLTPGNEVPPIVAPNADSTGSGTLTMTLNVSRDSAGSITGGATTFVVNMTGFPAGTSLTGAHIHANVAGSNAGIFLNSGLASGATVLANGSGTFTQSAVPTTAAQAEAFIANPAGHYFNVHTTLNTGGAIRGQLVLQ
jgi:hypothetical protein